MQDHQPCGTDVFHLPFYVLGILQPISQVSAQMMTQAFGLRRKFTLRNKVPQILPPLLVCRSRVKISKK